MFKANVGELKKWVKNSTVIGRMPELLNFLSALRCFTDGDHIQIPYAHLQKKVASRLKEKEEVQSVGVFGFDNLMRLLVRIQKRGINEVMFAITPESVTWQESGHKIRFRYELYEVTPIGQSLTHKVMEKGAGEITNLLLGPFLGFLGGIIIEQITTAVQEHTIKETVKFSEADVVQLGNTSIIVDLDKLSGKAGILTCPLEKFKLPSPLLRYLPALKNKCLADLIVLKEVKTSNKGLELIIETSQEGRELHSTIGALLGNQEKDVDSP